MRHLWSLIAGVVVAPLAWGLLAMGQDGASDTVAVWDKDNAFDTVDLIQPGAYLAGAGILLGLIATLRISPLGALVAALGYLGLSAGMFIEPFAVRDAVPDSWKIFGEPIPLRVPLVNGSLLAVGALLLVAVFSAKRWRRWPVAVAETAALEEDADAWPDTQVLPAPSPDEPTVPTAPAYAPPGTPVVQGPAAPASFPGSREGTAVQAGPGSYPGTGTPAGPGSYPGTGPQAGAGPTPQAGLGPQAGSAAPPMPYTTDAPTTTPPPASPSPTTPPLTAPPTPPAQTAPAPPAPQPAAPAQTAPPPAPPSAAPPTTAPSPATPPATAPSRAPPTPPLPHTTGAPTAPPPPPSVATPPEATSWPPPSPAAEPSSPHRTEPSETGGAAPRHAADDDNERPRDDNPPSPWAAPPPSR